MSSPRTSAQQFLLGPDKPPQTAGVRPSVPLPYHDPKAQKEKMSTFRRHLAASRIRSDEAIKRKVEHLREQRSKTTLSKSDIQRDMEAASRARVEEELGRPVSSNEWPFVYFVVTLDQFPVSADDPNGEQGTRGAQTARERQRFLTSRRRKIQEARNETERIREAGIDMGLRLEPIKPAAPPMEHTTMQKFRTRPSLTKHPTTPVSSIGSRPEFNHLNSHDDLSEVEMTRRNLGYIITDTLSQAGMVPKTGRAACPINSLELPEISASAKRRALGNSSVGFGMKGPAGLGERRVTFAEGLPVIKGNGIPVTNNNNNNNSINHNNLVSTASKSMDYSPSPMPSVSHKEKISREDETSLRPPWSTPLTTRSMSSLSSRSRLYAPMALPKVDIVSEIYDELIVKTIHNFLMAEGYSSDKLQQLRHTVLSRLSATYPHLVKHKAWRLTHSPCDKLTTADEFGEEVIMADPESLQPRIKPNQGRLNRVMVERGLTYDQMRPFTSPHGLHHSYHDVLSTQTFMAVDGKTVTFTPRDDTRTRTAGLLGSSNPTSRKLPTTTEEKEEDEDEEEEEEDSNKNDNDAKTPTDDNEEDDKTKTEEKVPDKRQDDRSPNTTPSQNSREGIVDQIQSPENPDVQNEDDDKEGKEETVQERPASAPVQAPEEVVKDE